MKGIRILHICQRDDASTGGAVRVGVDIVKNLIQKGWDAHCLFVYGSKGAFGDLLGENAHYLNLHSSKDVIKCGGKLRRFIKAFQPAIIHHHDGLLWTYLISAGGAFTKRVTHAHVAGGVRSFGFRTILANYVQRISTDLLLCISEHTRQTWLKHGYDLQKTCVIPNGVDTNVFYPATNEMKKEAKQSFGIPEEAEVVGFVGRLHNIMKGTDDYLKVIAKLPGNYWGLVIGQGQDEDELKRLAVQLGIGHRVVFAGALQNSMMGYHAMDVFAFTSHFEHFGLVVIEAMACRLPVVSFACPGGISDILTHETGVVLPERNHEQMCSEIQQIAVRSLYWQQRIMKAEAIVNEWYNWEKITLKVVSYYEQLLK
jgi:glycosyltransferase involved in cell wall biosynthesis